jgi:hypothetical protein
MTDYYAATAIEHGEEDGSVTRIEQDEKVTGLSEEVMQNLWDAGSLYVKDTEGEGDDKKEVQVTANTGDVPGQPTPPSMQGEDAELPKAPVEGGDPNRPGAEVPQDSTTVSKSKTSVESGTPGAATTTSPSSKSSTGTKGSSQSGS